MKFLSTFVVVVFVGLLGWLFVKEQSNILSVPPSSWLADHRADCGVVLTGGYGRVREGFDLLAQNNIKKLIISGVHPRAQLREIFPQWPFYGKLDESDVILERRSGTTYGNAQQSLVLVEALHCRDIVLVTSRLHMHRAYKTFRGVFPEGFPIYSRAVVSGQLLPSFIDRTIETTKSVFYSIWAY